MFWHFRGHLNASVNRVLVDIVIPNSGIGWDSLIDPGWNIREIDRLIQETGFLRDLQFDFDFFLGNVVARKSVTTLIFEDDHVKR